MAQGYKGLSEQHLDVSMAGKQEADAFAACSSGQTSSDRGQSSSDPDDAGKLTSAKEETRGITKRRSECFGNMELFTVVPATSDAQGEDYQGYLFPGGVEVRGVKVPVDSFPEDGGWWTPPLHGEDVASLYDLVVQELDNHRDDYKQFTRTLEDHGSCTRGIGEDFLLCFKNETILQPPETGFANLQGQMSEEDMSTVAAAFRVSGDKGRIVPPSTEEFERCLAGIPDHDWKRTWKSLHDVAVGAVKNGEWEVASTQYETCVQVLETMQDSILVHIHAWLLLWIYISLVNIYHLRLGNYQRCVTIFDDMLKLLISDAFLPRKQKRTEEEEDSLIRLFYSILWLRRLVLFEWSHKFETEDNQLVSRYVRSKAFDKIMVTRELGFIHFQQMVNCWSWRTKGREGDTRVAFCFNLQHLYTESKQHEKVVQWIKEKWRWVRDETHEPSRQWKLKLLDVASLFPLGVRSLINLVRLGKGYEPTNDYAKSIISDLEKIKSSLPPVVSDTVDYWNAVFLLESGRRKETEDRLQKLRERLEKRRMKKRSGSYTYENSDEEVMDKGLMALVKCAISDVLSTRKTFEMLEHRPFKVEVVDWPDVNDSFGLSLLEEVSDELDFPTHLTLRHAQRLVESVAKRFPSKEIETYRDRLYKAMDCLETHIRSIPEREDALQHADEVISYENIVETQREIREEQSLCHEYLGVCYVHAHKLKPRGVAYNHQYLQSELPVYNEKFLNMAIEHLRKALDLTETTGIDTIMGKLGWTHFAKVKEYHERLRLFICLAPFFRSQYLSLDEDARIQTSMGVQQLCVEKHCGNPCHDHVYFVHLGLQELTYYHLQSTSTDPFDAVAESGIRSVDDVVKSGIVYKYVTVRRYRQGLGLPQEYLTDEDLARVLQTIQGILIRELLLEIKRSSDYIQKSLEMGYGRVWKMRMDERVNDIYLLGVLEKRKNLFTIFQRLMVCEQTARQVIKEGGMSGTVISTPETAEYLRSQTNDLTPSQRALIYAERGRSSTLSLLIHEFLPEELFDNMAEFDMKDQKAWAIIRETQLSCGENTVFVEYTFDTTHEFLSDVMGTSMSHYDWKRCTWIVYVVTGEGAVHMRSYESHIPETLVAGIHRCLSNAEEADKVDKNLEHLYDVFIRPISDLLTDMKPENKLIFALDEVLTNVPFAILRNPQTGEYLFQNHTISFTPAFRVLWQCLQKHESLQRLPTVVPSVALGNPAYPPGSLRELPHTSDEVMSIPPLFKHGYVRTLTRTEATADKLLALAKLSPEEVRGFVHVAAHCLVDKIHRPGSLQLAYSNTDSEQNPSSSDSHSNRDADDEDEVVELEEFMGALAVGPDVRSGKERPSSRKTKIAKEALAKEKACLSSEKIMQCGFEWHTHMVGLSACNSAKGIILGSEGVVGLPRAFLAAGVPCIVASQWSLEDKSSSDLMEEFYREMSRGRDVATALRTAMLRRMRPDYVGSSNGHAAVYKWGGYLVWGCPTVTLPPSMLKH